MTPTPVRHIRIPDPLWSDSKTAAAGEGEKVPGVIQLALRAYITDPAATRLALAAILSGTR